MMKTEKGKEEPRELPIWIAGVQGLRIPLLCVRTSEQPTEVEQATDAYLKKPGFVDFKANSLQLMAVLQNI